MKKDYCAVMGRQISVTIGIPSNLTGDFIQSFGDSYGDDGFLATVDHYESVNNGSVRIKISTDKEGEEKFEQFLKNFCRQHSIELHLNKGL